MKMTLKIAYITVHVGINVGSNLQAIATSEILRRIGHKPILVNYIPPRVTFRRYWGTGESVWEHVKEKCDSYVSTVFDAAKNNGNLLRPTNMPQTRLSVYGSIDKIGYDKLQLLYSGLQNIVQ